jgi:sec-independent protein translocase protein TatC
VADSVSVDGAARVSGEMTLIEHLEELRTRLFKVVIAFVVGSIIAWFFYNLILGFLIRPLENLPNAEQVLSGGKLVGLSPTEPFFIRLKVTAFAGFVLALPVILWQLWRFVTPGLYPKEKRYALPFVAVSLALFAGGVAFAFWLFPQALRVLLGFAGTEVVIIPRASEYLSFVLLLIVAFGFTFEMPLILLALTIAGVLSTASLRKGRRVAWISIAVIAAVVTPTQDPYTMLMMAIPLALLYEATIIVARLLKR